VVLVGGGAPEFVETAGDERVVTAPDPDADAEDAALGPKR